MLPRFARLVLAALALCAGVAAAPEKAQSHATLVKAEPADGAVIAASPPVLRLAFNEPVSPLTFRLIGPDGAPIALAAAVSEQASVTVAPQRSLGQGTHLLSWRVVSSDGHPIGGSLIFSIGAPSAQPPAAALLADKSVHRALWAVKVLLYVGLFIGIGGAFFRAWIADPGSRAALSSILAALVGGLFAAPVSVGLQGLDALELSLSGLKQEAAWRAGLDTSYGLTAIAAVCALLAGVFSCAATSARLARGLSLVALLGVGAALALSGHASNAAPQAVSRAAVFVHTACVAFWVGALLPLLATVHGARGSQPLARFSRAIPFPLALLLASGLWLAFVQLGSLDALWTTSYGEVLFRKLVAVSVLLALGAANRYWLVPRLTRDGAARLLKSTIALELAIAIAILAIVALWRFTPPPRSLEAASTISVHIHGEKAMAEIEFVQDRPRGAKVSILVLDGAFQPLTAKEVTLVVANEGVGIEPLRRGAARAGDNIWLIEDVRIPVAGRWTLRVEILVNDFEKVTLGENVALPRMP